jgi:N-methylhydantoinase A
MANAARVHAVENGEDLSEYTMIAFGGAAPLHAGRLAEKLGIARTLVPTGAGVGSAIGFLRAPFSFESNRSVFMTMTDFDSAKITNIFAEMSGEAIEFVRTCDANAPIMTDYKIYMRYKGQGWEIPVDLTAEQAQNPDKDTFIALFEAEYKALFSRIVEGLEIEITVWSANAYTQAQKPDRVADIATTAPVTPAATRDLFDPALGKPMKAGLYERDTLSQGHSLEGPAAVTEAETTIIVPTSRIATALPDGCIALQAK